ncbi:acyl-CoA dehydrogenase family protein [Amycolatopsis acidiphila]|uniref:Acyl-CoA dehydrogenase n=1 Tax=Amycolatopsis acidiphila TaxID=715473 RepID=A0A558AP59_9PSEU|nr:acyl-CoA dehydrogenase family protein [Amycolatopsis acidiphila]TVT26060.1 acyl-CoA dehydrogenase [Amycolatopsis acidiphila]UIJ63218.1 acyl-CoA dehydrogenase family protein [Amycolatopsis acidiphila]GHG74412.1 acyl-CoA dehydrogenase [Amycolatopsis acidiphila]
MDLDFSPAQKEFREEVRTWLAEHKPAEPRPHDAAGIREYDLGWQRTQYEGGWAGISWPAEYGGRGLSLLEQLVWYEEYGRAGLPSLDSTFVGLNHAGPTLIERANAEQKAAHLPPILRGDVVWCQGFSEPEAGSDLASLRTRGVVDGDELVVSGQKIWTSNANLADWQELLVRTDTTVPKHRGITWVVCDMRAPGIDVRPIETMDGEHEFCEVFYDEVRIPLSHVVGAVNEGWSVAMSTLSFERGTAFTAGQVRLASTVEQLIALAADRSALADDELSRRLAVLRAEVAALRAMTYSAISRSARRGTPGPEGSIVKLYFSELEKRVARLSMDLLGGDSLRFRSRWLPGGWTGDYLHSFASTIGGGTSEVQRNIIGERVLGLPR